MAIALVKAGTLVTTLSPSFGQATGAGNLLVAWLAANNSSTTDPYSVSGTGWTKVVSAGASGAYSWVSLYYKMASAAGETAPVFSAAGSSTYSASQLAEFSGAATTSALDSYNSIDTDTASTLACTASDVSGGDLILAVTNNGDYDGAAPTITSMADSSGTAVTGTVAGSGYPGGGWGCTFAYGIAGSATGTSKDTITFSNTGYMVIASFKVPQGTSTSPAWAASYDTTAVAGTGTWTNPGNATGAADGSFAVWTAT